MLNMTALLELADILEENSNRFDMSTWGEYRGVDIMTDVDEDTGHTIPFNMNILNLIEHPCQTVGCIAGFQNSKMGRFVGNVGAAGNDLGLTFSQMQELFIPNMFIKFGSKTVWDNVNPEPDSANGKEAARLLRGITSGEFRFECDIRNEQVVVAEAEQIVHESEPVLV